MTEPTSGVMHDHRQEMPIIIVSRTLTYDVLACGRLSSSSQKFERGFAKACAAMAEVTVINVKGMDTCLSDGKLIDRIQFWAVGYRDLLGAIRKIAQGRRAVIISTGYDPILMSILVLCRLFRLRTFTFIYDTHKLAMQNRPLFRKAAIGFYYGVGFFVTRFVNGWIVLNDRFVLASRLPTPRYLKTRVGVDTPASASPRPAMPVSSGNRPVFLFSGTLNADNGTEILLRAVEQIRDQDFELHIYGYGPLEHLVEAAAKRDSRIVFFGRTDNADVTIRQRSADALIHLRDPHSVTAKYSYPSKLIEYLYSDRPVLSNINPEISDVSEMVILINAYNATCISTLIEEILDGRIAVPAFTDNSKRLALRQEWSKIAGDVIRFTWSKDT